MAVHIRIESLAFSGRPEEPVAVADSDVIVLVGANNAGKSRALRDIEAAASSGAGGAVVTDMKLHRSGSPDDLRTWIDRASSPMQVNEGQPEHRRLRSGTAFMVDWAMQHWLTDQPLVDLAELFLFRADAETRLSLANSVPSVDIINGEIILPLQRLLTDHAAEAELSTTTRRSFGEHVHVNRAGGSVLHLHLGTPHAEPRLDSPEYLAEVQQLPLVAAQGDGMRSFIGLMLVLAATPYPLLLVDEPEAFLHPPQATELGRQLGSAEEKQRLVATHSTDVLLGILDTAMTPTVIRLRRDGARNVPYVLDPEQVQKIWNDPSLRYSNLLNGLFHQGVVISEADGDARLYAAALDADQAAQGRPNSDLLFAQCGGKHKLPDAITALRPMGVPVAAIADIDVLRDETLLRNIVEALGGDWEPLKPDWKIISTAVAAQAGKPVATGEMRQRLADILGEDDLAALDKSKVKNLREAARLPDGWSQAKEGGLSILPRGDASAAQKRLIPALANIGLFVVPVGTLERWAPEIGGYGSRFTGAALSADVHKSNVQLRSFVVGVERFLTGNRPSERHDAQSSADLPTASAPS